MRFQQTIDRPVEITGFGLWTGKDVTVRIKPAATDTGRVFVRTDLPDMPRIPATVSRREPKPRQTSLVAEPTRGIGETRYTDNNGVARVDMVEHLIAALRGAGVDNCEIHLNQAEIPGCDGSSLPFLQAIDTAKIVIQDVPRQIRRVTEPFEIVGGGGIIRAEPNDEGLKLTYHLEFPEGHPIGNQSFEWTFSAESFRTEVAPCRTFLTKMEADQLLAAGLCRRVATKDVLVFAMDGTGPLDNPLRFPNECVRHKVLDMLGDLSLGDFDLYGSFTARRTGHQQNAECLMHL